MFHIKFISKIYYIFLIFLNYTYLNMFCIDNHMWVKLKKPFLSTSVWIFLLPLCGSFFHICVALSSTSVWTFSIPFGYGFPSHFLCGYFPLGFQNFPIYLAPFNPYTHPSNPSNPQTTRNTLYLIVTYNHYKRFLIICATLNSWSGRPAYSVGLFESSLARHGSFSQ